MPQQLEKYTDRIQAQALARLFIGLLPTVVGPVAP